MKKSILALGAAVAVGGFGFAGAAHAVAFFGPGTIFTHTSAPAATTLKQNVGGTGHMLYTPYYSAQGSVNTMLNIVNTDTRNGKAVKVRFRGAANSDDVLDFTVLLSPGDVWTAGVSQGADGLPVLRTVDNSCTLPAIPENGVSFNDGRLPAYLSEDARKNHTREGYVEFLNMADIPPSTVKDSLYQNIKHNSKGVPGNCAGAGVSELITTTVVNAAGAQNAGLFAPTGGLMGSWTVLNQTELAVHSGAMTAVRAQNAAGANAYGNIIFSPQNDVAINNAVAVNTLTADPLLHATGAAPGVRYLEPQWYDLPDMSTPLVAGFSPAKQILEMDIARTSVMNEYLADPKGSVPMVTDWVVSQPTRRYYAAVDYSTGADKAQIVFNNNMTTAAPNATTVAPTSANNAYGVLRLNQMGDMGPYACITAAVGTTDREESTIAQGATFSPGVTSRLCGEVFTVSFGGASVLESSVANVKLPNPAGKEGWGTLNLSGGAALPIVGFAASSAKNVAAKTNYGQTLPYRW